METKALTLFELNKHIKSTLSDSFPNPLWIIAEVSELRYNRNGHCYLELIQKEEDSDKIVAKARATIWSYSFRMLKPYFETTSGHEFTNGIKILVNVSVDFHEQYGLSLNITDIDPSYTLGDMVRKKIEIIAKLEKEGVINMNKELEIPQLPQKIAVISSKTAAGYDDFKNQLENNPYHYKFYLKLFPAVMQGVNAEESITAMLDKIFQYENFFDLVVIIRGGGSKSNLSCFDNYWLAYNITQFPIPILTGIGHERDDSITDMVAHTRLKTPTAVAEFLINKIADFDNQIGDLINDYTSLIRNKLSECNNQIHSMSKEFQYCIKNKLLKEKMNLKKISTEVINAHQKFSSFKHNNLKENLILLKNATTVSLQIKNQEIDNQTNSQKYILKDFFTHQLFQISLFRNTIEHSNPEKLFEKGYSITTINDKIITDVNQIKENNLLKTFFKNGHVDSLVKNVEKKS